MFDTMLIWLILAIIFLLLAFTICFVMSNCCYCFPQPKQTPIILSESLKEIIVTSSTAETESLKNSKNTPTIIYSKCRNCAVNNKNVATRKGDLASNLAKI